MGFAIGVGICVIYWIFGFIPREIWFGSPVTATLITGQTWVWPTATLGVLFRDLNIVLGVIAMYSLNGLVYGLISTSLFVAKRNPIVYVLLALTVLSLIAWFNVAIMQTFSWVWLIVVSAGLGIIGYWDLRQARRS